METTATLPGQLIRQWRTRRRLSQLDLAADADISQRHLSFVESGRSKPSRDMIVLLAERLALPLRERNALLVAGGYAPIFPQRGIDDPALDAAMKAVEAVLAGHEPNPALAVDRHWTLLRHNAAVAPFLAEIEDASLLAPPVNVLRLSLHPKGMAPRIENFAEWRDHIVERLRRSNDAVADPAMLELERELRAYPVPRRTRPPATGGSSPLIAIPLRLRFDGSVLSFISTITVFGTPLDVTLSELAIESFFAADAPTAEVMRRLERQRAAAP